MIEKGCRALKKLGSWLSYARQVTYHLQEFHSPGKGGPSRVAKFQMSKPPGQN